MAPDSRDEILRAVEAGDIDALRLVVDAKGGALVRLDEDPEQLTALHVAAAAGQLAAVEYLLSASVGADPRGARINNFTPLHAAAMNGEAAICEVLLRAGAAVDMQTQPQGYAALHSAAFGGHVDALRVLLAHAADRSLLNYRGERPADTARRQGQDEAAALLDAPPS